MQQAELDGVADLMWECARRRDWAGATTILERMDGEDTTDLFYLIMRWADKIVGAEWKFDADWLADKSWPSAVKESADLAGAIVSGLMAKDKALGVTGAAMLFGLSVEGSEPFEVDPNTLVDTTVWCLSMLTGVSQ